MQTQRKTASFSLLCLVVITLCVGCGAGAKLGTGAANQVFATMGKSSGEISASADDIARQSQIYGISQDAMTSVAQNADATDGWNNAQTQVTAIYRVAKDDEATQVAVSVGCDGLAGELKTEAEIQTSLLGAVTGLYASRLQGLVQSTKDLQEKLALIRRTGSENDRAAAAWLCYAYQVAP